MKVNKNIEFDYELYEITTGSMLNSVLDDEGNIITRLFQCKDYMQDLYWAEKLKTNIIQYGLKYDGTKLNNLVGKESIKLLVTSKNDSVDYTLVISNIIKALNLVEHKFGFINSTFELVDDNKNDVVIIFSEEWFDKPYLISLFMLLVKVTSNFVGESIDDLITFLESKDKSITSNYLSQLQYFNAHNVFKELFIDVKLHDCKWENYKSSQQIHDGAGLMSFYQIEICQPLAQTVA